jgi:hypothetical protein
MHMWKKITKEKLHKEMGCILQELNLIINNSLDYVSTLKKLLQKCSNFLIRYIWLFKSKQVAIQLWIELGMFLFFLKNFISIN